MIIWRRRRRELQKKHAARGIDTPVEVLTEIEDVSKRIRDCEEEIATLKAQAAADHAPITEIEYQAKLAEEWDASAGRLKLAQRTRLDWMRVRLGITPERAQAMEHTLRAQLAEELFDDLNLNYLPHKFSNVPQPPTPFDFARLRKAILLDCSTAVRLFLARLLRLQHYDLDTLQYELLGPHAACRQDDLDLFSQFLIDVRAALAQAGAAHQ